MKTISRILALSLLLAGMAKADVPPLDTEPCRTKAAGAACTYNGAAGTCESASCNRLDYANWNRDASASPPTTSYACVVCKPGTTTGTLTTTGTATDSGTDPAEKKDTGCQIGGLTARRAAPWMMAGSFSLLFLFVRRRRAR